MHKLPTANSPLRQLFEVSDLAKIGTGEMPIHVSDKAGYFARRLMASDKAIRQVIFFGLCASDDNICLYRIGARGAMKRLWVFGPCTRQTKLA